ncbi:MAG: DUF192 domain-containing protein [Actinomycetota bacterium]
MDRLILVRDGRTIAEATERATTWAARLRGLIGRTGLPSGAALMLCPARQVHTFGMRFPIDVIVCDRRLLVLHVARTLRPHRLTRFVRRGHYVFELPAGDADGIVPGDGLAVITTGSDSCGRSTRAAVPVESPRGGPRQRRSRDRRPR